jgi:hypothetical protein
MGLVRQKRCQTLPLLIRRKRRGDSTVRTALTVGGG